jgi:Lrp/AsnC family leucine-responsive transcriptional regulator
MFESSPEIDRIDLKILNVLQQDGRISNLKLAESVALSPTAVLARVQRLTRDGYILGYEALLNPLKLGAGMMVFVEVLLDRTTPNVFEAFKAAVQVHHEITECHMVAGGFDYLHRALAAAGRARNPYLCGDGRSQEHHPLGTGRVDPLGAGHGFASLSLFQALFQAFFTFSSPKPPRRGLTALPSGPPWHTLRLKKRIA